MSYLVIVMQLDGVPAQRVNVFLDVHPGDDQAQPVAFRRIDLRDDVDLVTICVNLRKHLQKVFLAGNALGSLLFSQVCELPNFHNESCPGFRCSVEFERERFTFQNGIDNHLNATHAESAINTIRGGQVCTSAFHLSLPNRST